MIKFTPVMYQVEESSIYIEQIKPEVYVVKEGHRYLNGHDEWISSPTLFSLANAKQVVEDYFEERN